MPGGRRIKLNHHSITIQDDEMPVGVHFRDIIVPNMGGDYSRQILRTNSYLQFDFEVRRVLYRRLTLFAFRKLRFNQYKSIKFTYISTNRTYIRR